MSQHDPNNWKMVESRKKRIFSAKKWNPNPTPEIIIGKEIPGPIKRAEDTDDDKEIILSLARKHHLCVDASLLQLCISEEESRCASFFSVYSTNGRVENGKAFTCTCRKTSQLLGFALCCDVHLMNEEIAFEIVSFFVDPKFYFFSKVESQLYRMCEEECRQRGRANVIVSLAENTWNTRFWKHMGFVPCATPRWKEQTSLFKTLSY